MSKKHLNTIIRNSGVYIPDNEITKEYFHDRVFYNPAGEKMSKPTVEIAQNLVNISGIEKRCYVMNDDHTTSKIAALSVEDMFKNENLNRETLDYIFTAHNFGDVGTQSTFGDFMPSISAKVKKHLEIENPLCLPHDTIFGCPGWVQGFIIADQIMTEKQKSVVIGSEILSRVVDKHDPNSMLFGDSAGSVLVEKVSSDEKFGVLYHKTYCHSTSTLHYLVNDGSNNPDDKGGPYIKMVGKKVFEYAITYLPELIINGIEELDIDVHEVSHFILHQANKKINDTVARKIEERFKTKLTKEIPLSLLKYGNTSVATIPVLYHKMAKGEMGEENKIKPNQIIIFASVGAGMYCNVVIYKAPPAGV